MKLLIITEYSQRDNPLPLYEKKLSLLNPFIGVASIKDKETFTPAQSNIIMDERLPVARSNPVFLLDLFKLSEIEYLLNEDLLNTLILFMRDMDRDDMNLIALFYQQLTELLLVSIRLINYGVLYNKDNTPSKKHIDIFTFLLKRYIYFIHSIPFVLDDKVNKEHKLLHELNELINMFIPIQKIGYLMNIMGVINLDWFVSTISSIVSSMEGFYIPYNASYNLDAIISDIKNITGSDLNDYVFKIIKSFALINIKTSEHLKCISILTNNIPDKELARYLEYHIPTVSALTPEYSSVIGSITCLALGVIPMFPSVFRNEDISPKDFKQESDVIKTTSGNFNTNKTKVVTSESFSDLPTKQKPTQHQLTPGSNQTSIISPSIGQSVISTSSQPLNQSGIIPNISMSNTPLSQSSLHDGYPTAEFILNSLLLKYSILYIDNMTIDKSIYTDKMYKILMVTYDIKLLSVLGYLVYKYAMKLNKQTVTYADNLSDLYINCFLNFYSLTSDPMMVPSYFKMNSRANSQFDQKTVLIYNPLKLFVNDVLSILKDGYDPSLCYYYEIDTKIILFTDNSVLLLNTNSQLSAHWDEDLYKTIIPSWTYKGYKYKNIDLENMPHQFYPFNFVLRSMIGLASLTFKTTTGLLNNVLSNGKDFMFKDFLIDQNSLTSDMLYKINEHTWSIILNLEFLQSSPNTRLTMMNILSTLSPDFSRQLMDNRNLLFNMKANATKLNITLITTASDLGSVYREVTSSQKILISYQSSDLILLNTDYNTISPDSKYQCLNLHPLLNNTVDTDQSVGSTIINEEMFYQIYSLVGSDRIINYEYDYFKKYTPVEPNRLVDMDIKKQVFQTFVDYQKLETSRAVSGVVINTSFSMLPFILLHKPNKDRVLFITTNTRSDGYAFLKDTIYPFITHFLSPLSKKMRIIIISNENGLLTK